MILDAHQHVWSLARGDYGWLTPEVGGLFRDFDLADYAAAAPFVDASILVQAAPTDAETDYLLSLAEGSDRVAGVVGWVDLAAASAPARLGALAARPKFLGARPMLQDLPDPDWIDRPELGLALDRLAGLGLSFDALVRSEHLPALTRMAARHPDLRIIINHGAKPDIAGGELSDWRAALAPLAAMPQVVCKVSGLPNEAGAGWRPEVFAPWITTLVELFGPGRLMWGSDWPVLTQVTNPMSWHGVVHEAIAPLGEDAVAQVFGATARRAYRLSRGAHGWVRD
jgi:L-fuconolactonase